jgi:ribosome recycling factor
MAYDFSKLKANIKETEEWLMGELAGVRTGRATPTLLDAVRPEAYGARTLLRELASVSVEDARTLRVIPWDKTLTKAVEKGITEADLGVGLATDSEGLRVTFPELTSERRVQLTSIASDKAEQARVTLRSYRTDALKALVAAEAPGGMGEDEMARLKVEIQKLIDAANDALAKILEKKKVEIAQ